ncbi:hypothetical protein C5167_023620 [Papaver somniferum]|uniref:E2F-associated phosphoprotein n=1 Tax=Papaver somniferum TaxID=3469 RepID=A0A4Y7JQ16_PAPSO|nr:E2F-associated phosphoprotein-like [Papaver somniferum]RZC61819.1 hypothetical protein C5167_023620 [Papaver somniferum]
METQTASHKMEVAREKEEEEMAAPTASENMEVEMEKEVEEEDMASPTASQKTVSDDDEIDYSVKPEFYDPKLDNKDELWVQKERKGRDSDAVLTCPACFTTLCLECQRHEKYLTQYRAIFIVNCKIKINQVLRPSNQKPKTSKKRGRERGGIDEVGASTKETFKPVCCVVCSTEVGVIDEDEVYHFFNVLPGES